jgi:hypothetical protein
MATVREVRRTKPNEIDSRGRKGRGTDVTGRRGRIPKGSYYKGKVVCEDCGDCGKDVMGLLTWDRGALFSYNRITNLEFYEFLSSGAIGFKSRNQWADRACIFREVT